MSDWITDRDTTLQILTRIYTAGYQRGHDETVESTYLHIYPDYLGTYFSDYVKELMQELPNEANARLIAAAPEMLEALKACAAHIGNMPHPDFVNGGPIDIVYAQALQAIAKAEGREP